MSLISRVRGFKVPRRLWLTLDKSVSHYPRFSSHGHLKWPPFPTGFKAPKFHFQHIFNVSQRWQSFQSNSTRHWWNWWERFSAKIFKSVNQRCLLCAGAIFLWDREKITNQEISKSLSNYERRINGKMQSLKESIGPVGEEAIKTAPPDGDKPINDNNGGNTPPPADSATDKDQPAIKSNENNQKVTKEEEPIKPKHRRSYRQTSTHNKKKSSLKHKKSSKPSRKHSKEEEDPEVVKNQPQMTDSTPPSPPLNKEVEINSASIDNSTNHEEDRSTEYTDPMKGWVLMSEQEHCKVYSKPYGSDGLSQYKAVGYYSDITARDFLDVQVGEDRRSWDSYCLSLKTVDHDSSTGSEIIHWVVKFPFPMSDRDYVFVRRHWISPNDDAVVVISRSVEHPAVPVNRKYIRVKTFFSELVLKPVTFIDEVGFHFELTYFDNPGSNIPSSAMSWATKSALPDFLNKIYQAVLRKQVSDRHHKHHLA